VPDRQTKRTDSVVCPECGTAVTLETALVRIDPKSPPVCCWLGPGCPKCGKFLYEEECK
jgi:hypothetical protein